jgi:WD40 repeat protein
MKGKKAPIFLITLWLVISNYANGQNYFKQIIKLEGHNGGISSLAFSPDGRFLVSGSQDETLRIWDLSSFKTEKTISKLGSAATSLCFSPDGSFLAIGQYEYLKIYRTKNWKLKTKKKAFLSFIENLAICPDSNKIAASSWKDKSLSIFNFPDLTNEKILNETTWTDAISFSQDGKFLASGSHANSIKIWDSNSGNLLNQFQNHEDWVYGVSFINHDSNLVSTSLDKSIVITDLASGKILAKKENAHSEGITYSLLIKKEAEPLLVTISLDKTLKVWKLRNFELLGTFSESKQKLITLAVSADSSFIATGGADGIIYLLRK